MSGRRGEREEERGEREKGRSEMLCSFFQLPNSFNFKAPILCSSVPRFPSFLSKNEQKKQGLTGCCFLSGASRNAEGERRARDAAGEATTERIFVFSFIGKNEGN